MGATTNNTTNWAGTQTGRLPSTAQATANAPKSGKLRGFAAMDPERQRQIASQGGRSAHASGRAHQFTSEEARAAGRKRHAKTNAAKLSA